MSKRQFCLRAPPLISWNIERITYTFMRERLGSQAQGESVAQRRDQRTGKGHAAKNLTIVLHDFAPPYAQEAFAFILRAIEENIKCTSYSTIWNITYHCGWGKASVVKMFHMDRLRANCGEAHSLGCHRGWKTTVQHAISASDVGTAQSDVVQPVCNEQKSSEVQVSIRRSSYSGFHVHNTEELYMLTLPSLLITLQAIADVKHLQNIDCKMHMRAVDDHRT